MQCHNPFLASNDLSEKRIEYSELPQEAMNRASEPCVEALQLSGHVVEFLSNMLRPKRSGCSFSRAVGAGAEASARRSPASPKPLGVVTSHWAPQHRIPPPGRQSVGSAGFPGPAELGFHEQVPSG